MKSENHNMYKFVSSGGYEDSKAFRDTNNGVVWEGPSFINRQLREVKNTQEFIFDIILGTWGSVENTLIGKL